MYVMNIVYIQRSTTLTRGIHMRCEIIFIFPIKDKNNINTLFSNLKYMQLK